jgi:hypothetical protein
VTIASRNGRERDHDNQQGWATPEKGCQVKGKSSFSSERYRRGLQVRLILGGMFLLLAVGGGLVWLFYGRTAAATAAACVVAAGAVFGLLWLILGLLGWWVKGDEP